MVGAVIRVGPSLLLGAVVIAAAWCGTAFGESAPGTAWKVSVSGQPTDVAASGGQYDVELTNTGSVASSGPITLTMTLPAGMTAQGVGVGYGDGWGCAESGSASVWTCSWNSSVAVFGETGDLEIDVGVTAPAGAVLTTRFVASGGGAPVAKASTSGVAGEPSSAFGFVDFGVQTFDLSGAPDTQAGGSSGCAGRRVRRYPRREWEACAGHQGYRA